jgi:hypothetical protein
MKAMHILPVVAMMSIQDADAVIVCCLQHNTCPVCRHSLPVDEELQREAQQQRRAQLRQPFQHNEGGNAQQAPGAAPGAQTIADFANTLIAQLTLAQGHQGGAGMIAIPVFHVAGASPHERRPTNDGRPARIVRARIGRPDEVRSRSSAQPAPGNSQSQSEGGYAADQPSNQDMRSEGNAGAEPGRGPPLCRLQ